MKENFTSINVVLDESGSMAGRDNSLTLETISGINTFLADQKSLPGEAVFTLCTFNSSHRVVHDFVKLGNVNDLSVETYRPSGYTALLDALGTTITNVGQKLAAMKEEDRPSKVLFLVITDGIENASHSFTRDQIRTMVKHQQDVYNWEFVFMGANIDAFAEGASIGVASHNTKGFDASVVGTRGLYADISKGTTAYRSAKSPAAGAFFTPKK